MAKATFEESVKVWMGIFGFDRTTAEEFARKESKHAILSIEDLLAFFNKPNEPEIIIGCW